MAEKRMFSKSLIERDCFTELPLSAQALYFHLGLRMDDDGFCDRLKNTLKMIGASEDDLACLISAGFLYKFSSGVVVDLYWPTNNNIRKDRYKPTIHTAERDMLEVTKEGIYVLKEQLQTETTTETNGIPSDNQTETNGMHRLDKVRLDKDRGERETRARAGEDGYVYLDEEAIEIFQNSIRPLKNIHEAELIRAMVEDYGIDRFKDAVEIAKQKRPKVPFPYLESVLRNNKNSPPHNDPVAGAAAALKLLESGEILDFNNSE